MAFDFKKEYKEFYMPKSKPEIRHPIKKVVDSEKPRRKM